MGKGCFLKVQDMAVEATVAAFESGHVFIVQTVLGTRRNLQNLCSVHKVHGVVYYKGIIVILYSMVKGVYNVCTVCTVI